MTTTARDTSDAEAPTPVTVQGTASRGAHGGSIRPAGSERSRKQSSQLVRRLVALVIVMVLVPLIALAAVDLRLTSALDRIDNAFTGLDDRPALATDGSVTMLLLATGVGRPDDPSLAWRPGDPRVAAAVFVTISGNRQQVNLDWLPLRGPVRAGLSDAVPSSSVAAAEAWTGRRVDHLAVIDWSTLARLGHDNDVTDELAPGAGRGQQQAYLREVLEDTLHAEMRKEPWTLYRALHTTAEGMAVEEQWSAFDMFRLVFSLRDMRSAQIVFGAIDEPATP